MYYYKKHTISSNSIKLMICSTVITCLLFTSFYSTITHFSNEPFNKNDQTNNNTDLDASDDFGPAMDGPFTYNNISQFNVTESGGYKAIQRNLDLDDNLEINIPSGWQGTTLDINIPNIYEPLEYFDAGNLNGLWDDDSEWKAYSDYERSSPDSGENYAVFDYDDNDNFGTVEYHSIDNSLPYDFNGWYYTHDSKFNHASDEVIIGGLIEEETSEFPIDEEFEEDPDYNKLEAIYGGSNGWSSVYGAWDPSPGSLTTGIDTTGSFFKGSPSVAWQTYFYIPFEADSVTITYSWAVDNFGVEAEDEFKVKSRINNAYVDGREGINGQKYWDADYDALEYDDENANCTDHDFWTRTYNITELVGSYGYRKGWHSLDFGALLDVPNNGNDDILVTWDYISINATHYDWYSAAELSFDYFMTDLSGQNPESQEDLTLAVYFGFSESDDDSMRWNINETSHLIYGTDYDDRVEVNISIPHTYAPIFEVDELYFWIGLEKAPRYNEMEDNPTVDFHQKLSIDTFYLHLNYEIGSPDSEILEGRFLPGGSFQRFYSTNSFDLSSLDDIEIEFQLSGGYSNPQISYNAYVNVSRTDLRGAEASASVDNLDAPKSLWTVNYNNSESFVDFIENPYGTNDYVFYDLIIENLPAHDGNELDSGDWNITSVSEPDEYISGINYQITSDTNFLQNITISYPRNMGERVFGSGLWQINATQENYLMNCSMRHDDFSSPDKYYHLEYANYTHEVRDTTAVTGNFNITLFNSTSKTANFSSRYYTFTGTDNNKTQPWRVWDEGAGEYKLVGFWNDTTSRNQTTRLGWYKDTFEMWRKTNLQILSDLDGDAVPSGELANYQFQYNITFGSNRGVSGATIQAKNNDTQNLWGQDWGYNWLDFHVKTDKLNGTYNMALKTAGIELADYNISFSFSKAFYDPIEIPDTLWLNVTGVVSYFDIAVLDGGFNDTMGIIQLTSDNIPVVNDTSTAIIQLNITKKSTGEAVRDVVISAQFNTTDSLIYAYEVFAFTFNPADKGIYNLSLDTTGLHATDTPSYPSSYSNYTLTIWFSKEGYSPEATSATVQIDPLPLYIDTDDIEDVYKGGSIDIAGAIFSNIGGVLECYKQSWVQYTISNGSGYLQGGTLEKGVANLYSTSVSVAALFAGDYEVAINASGTDLVTTVSQNIEFSIQPKYRTQISFILPENIRIGPYLSVAAKLTYINGTAIPGQDLILSINYSDTYQYLVLVETDSAGKGVYQFNIPYYYEGETLTISAEYDGAGLLLSSSNTIQKPILGKIPSDIAITDPPAYVQVGYNATFSLDLSIEEDRSVDGRLIYILGFYDDATTPFLIRELSTDQNGSASYTFQEIDDGYEEITVQFEYLGDSEIDYISDSVTIPVYPKWVTYLDMVSLPSELRLGQKLEFNTTIFSPNGTFSESYAGEPLEFIFTYDTATQTYTKHADADGNIIFDHQIPDAGVSTLEINVTYAGTNKIAQNTTVMLEEYSILPKKTTSITFTSKPAGELITGEYVYSLILEDSDNNALSGVEVQIIILDQNDAIVTVAYTGVTNNEGMISTSINFNTLPPGYYKIVADFDGETFYESSVSSAVEVDITTYFLEFMDLLPYIIGAVAIVLIGSFIVYKTVVIPKRERRRAALRVMHQRLTDAESITYLLILNPGGLNIFEHSFSNIPIDGTLVSGFLSAISSFGDEIGRDMKNGKSGKGLEELSYKQFKIVVSDAALCRVALLLTKRPSDSIKKNAQRFTLAFQERFFDRLDSNKPMQTLNDGPVLELVENYLDVDLLYPHNVNIGLVEDYKKSVDKKSVEHNLLEVAQSKDYNNTFYIREMMDELSLREIEDIEAFNAIDRLRKENIVFAINPRTRSLIEQFTPIIDRLPEMARKILLLVMDGLSSDIKLKKSLKIGKNVIDSTEYDNSMKILREMGLIDKNNGLTELGEAVATILNLI